MSETENIETASAEMQSAEIPETAATEEPVEAVESTEPVEAAEPVEVVAEETKPKRRIRGTTLLTAAIVLGVLGGVGTGYAIQYARPATPLPPLAGSQPVYAPVGVYQGIAAPMLPSSQDDAALTDGDLTKLLLPVPSGASTDGGGWLDQTIDEEELADTCDRAVNCFTNDLRQGVVAIADTAWVQNGFDVEIRMYRMAPGDSGTARNWAEYDEDEANQIPMPTGIEGSGYEYLDSDGDNDDTAYTVHGDLAMQFWVSSSSKMPNPSLLDGLITQQMGRL